MIKCKCGHETYIPKEDYKKGWIPELCHNCYKEKQDAERKKENLKLKEEQLEKGYPKLNGTEKQELWGYKLRVVWIKFYEMVKNEQYKECKEDEHFLKCYNYLQDIVLKETDSKFYINNSHITMLDEVNNFVIKNNQ